METMSERLRETIELLESIAADRTVLEDVPAEDRQRLLQAVARVYSPDRAERRRMAKIAARERKARAGAGVRSRARGRPASARSARKPIFHTPTSFRRSTSNAVSGCSTSGTRSRTTASQHCYVCKEKYTEIHHFYDQMCPACAELNFSEAH